MNLSHPSIIKMKERDEFINLLTSELLSHGVVKVTALGVFRLKKMKAHTRYIPGSKKIGKVPARVKLSFMPTKSFKANVQQYGK